MAVALERIENILTSEYSVQNYVQFVQELFDSLELVAPDKFHKEFTNYSSHIVGNSHVGNYTDPDGKKMIVAAVELKKASYVEGSRSTQRSYAKKLIENAGADAALIAFYTKGDPKWRLSYIRLDYEMKFENGKLKTAENMTPAKRYSFLVGQDEPCHTAVDRFRRFLEDHNFHPTLDELEEAFSVEAVTNQFFQLYCEKFKQLLVHLEDNKDFVIEAEQHNFTAAQFAKKLMGQIVFLYFLQKKGWLGVKAWPDTLTEKEYKKAFFARGAKSRELIPRVYKKIGDDLYKLSPSGLESLTAEDEEVLAQCVKGKPWGSGPHNFMRKLFDIAEKNGENFFDDYLEPLFYDALNVNRGEQGYDPALHCRIPFLSGGLFEPIDGYDWKHNDFAIPNEVFSNRIDNNPRTGDGILDIFDRYNFTMSEDEPMEREVAIDPEMLGKVFENLLEVNDRKAKGAFYTPREIVHYMCQESLINYLTTTLNVSEGAIRDFILYGDLMKDEDTVKEKRQGNGGMYISNELYELDAEGKVVVNRLPELDKALADVRVADPAVGSGAFPLGMLNEIVRARQNISAYYAISMKPYDIRMMYTLERAPYTLKYETIKNCIYAADIEPSAVDIAQLRLWLALVIDDEINPEAQSPLDGHHNPLPLPNLESNILCGNSLLDEFEGIPLINQSELIGTTRSNQQIDMYQSGFESVLQKLIDAQDRLFCCDDAQKKQAIQSEIVSYRDIIISSQMQGCADSGIMERYEESKNNVSKPYILWQLDFSRVFRDKGGFDIVIGNPPYVSTKGQSQADKNALMKEYGYADDLYYHFIDKAFSIANRDGILAYITPDTYYTTLTKKSLREKLLNKTMLKLIQLGHNVFESAMVSTGILIVKNNKGQLADCIECIDVKNHKSINDAPHYLITNETYRHSINGSFYMPTPFNVLLDEKLANIHSKLLQKYFPMIATSRDIEKNEVELKQYRESLEENSWTLIGLVTEGGQGLATGNNGRFVGVREGTKEATRIRDSRLDKFSEFKAAFSCDYEMPTDESQIWELFEDLKEKYGRDIFGQGYLYKIVPPELVRDASTLSQEEKNFGIVSGPMFVTYDKGDKEGNRWYNETPFLIDWSRESVNILKANSGKRGQGSSRFQNSQFYFREGFSYSDIKTFLLKARMKGISIHDVKSMSLFPLCEKTPYYYIITLLNTEVIATLVYNFLNNTPSFQMNDCRMLPIKVPSEQQLLRCKELFDASVNIQKSYFEGNISREERDKQLAIIQKDIDEWACELYDIPTNYLKGQQNYVR